MYTILLYIFFLNIRTLNYTFFHFLILTTLENYKTFKNSQNRQRQRQTRITIHAVVLRQGGKADREVMEEDFRAGCHGIDGLLKTGSS